ncbi:MAG: DUF1467 family protein [Marivibrio sp.]|uniref:DUF1467 family protein n=1 Tax=Marivibrio sp. TaxID=2039719 RepID=UPI0032EBDA50
MGPVSGFVVFIILWWLVLFMVLPFGVQRDDNPDAGHDHGAPKFARIGKKMAITTALATLLFLGYWAIVAFDLITLKPPGA